MPTAATRAVAAARGGFEGWRPLKWEDRANYDWMHEMLYEVLLHSKARKCGVARCYAVGRLSEDSPSGGVPDVRRAPEAREERGSCRTCAAGCSHAGGYAAARLDSAC